MSGVINSTGSKSGVIGTTELDYEEGDWTPAYGLASVSYNSRYGKYIKIGKIVHIWSYVNLASHSSSTGTINITISGLPFAYTDGGTTTPGAGVIFGNNSGTIVSRFRTEGTSSTEFLARGDHSTTDNLYLSFTYNTM